MLCPSDLQQQRIVFLIVCSMEGEKCNEMCGRLAELLPTSVFDDQLPVACRLHRCCVEGELPTKRWLVSRAVSWSMSDD